jgi:threonine dehydratase
MRRFQARSDDGEVFTVIEHQPLAKHRSLSDGASLLPKLKRYTLSDGSAVNQIGADTYKIVQTGQIIRTFLQGD